MDTLSLNTLQSFRPPVPEEAVNWCFSPEPTSPSAPRDCCLQMPSFFSIFSIALHLTGKFYRYTIIVNLCFFPTTPGNPSRWVASSRRSSHASQSAKPSAASSFPLKQRNTGTVPKTPLLNTPNMVVRSQDYATRRPPHPSCPPCVTPTKWAPL